MGPLLHARQEVGKAEEGCRYSFTFYGAIARLLSETIPETRLQIIGTIPTLELSVQDTFALVGVTTGKLSVAASTWMLIRPVNGCPSEEMIQRICFSAIVASERKECSTKKAFLVHSVHDSLRKAELSETEVLAGLLELGDDGLLESEIMQAQLIAARDSVSGASRAIEAWRASSQTLDDSVLFVKRPSALAGILLMCLSQANAEATGYPLVLKECERLVLHWLSGASNIDREAQFSWPRVQSALQWIQTRGSCKDAEDESASLSLEASIWSGAVASANVLCSGERSLRIRCAMLLSLASCQETSTPLQHLFPPPPSLFAGRLATFRKKPKEWISDAEWNSVCFLSNKVATFVDLPESFVRSEQSWSSWLALEAPERVKVRHT